MTEVTPINAYEMTGEAAFRNLFIRCQAQYQMKLSCFEEEKKKNNYNISLLLEAEDCLMRSRVIAREQYLRYKSVDFKSWMRNERWTYGGTALLIAYHKHLNRMEDVTRLEAYSEGWCNMVESLDLHLFESPDFFANSAAHPDFAAKFNELKQTGHLYLKAVSTKSGDLAEKRKKEDKMFFIMFAHVRSVVQILCSGELPQEVFIKYSKGELGDILAVYIAAVLERRDFCKSDPEEEGKENQSQVQAFRALWESTYKVKLELCSLFARELGRQIQDSISLYIYYDNLSSSEKILQGLIDNVQTLIAKARRATRAAAENIAAVAKQSVQWEFLRAGLYTTFWLILAPVCLMVDACQGNTGTAKEPGTSWYHGMNSKITAAWEKSPVTVLSVVAGMIVTTVFIGLASAASFGAVPAVASALLITHTSIAIAGTITLVGGALIGGYAWKSEEQKRIEDNLQAELKAIDLEKHATDLINENGKMKKKVEAAKQKKAAIDSVANKQDLAAKRELLRRQCEEAMKKADDELNDVLNPPFQPVPPPPNNVADLQRGIEMQLASMSEEELMAAATELGKVQRAYAEQVRKLRDELEKLEGKEDIVRKLREESR